MTFCETIWKRTRDLRQAIDALPFNRELAAGTLAPSRFRFYILQDKLYLDQYARVLALAAAKAPDTAAMEKFTGSARGALAVEQALHGQFLARFGIGEAEALATEPSPACLAYASFLLATGHQESWPVAVAAILPCFWIYHDVGTRIAGEAAADNPYRAWIDTYAAPGFAKSVKEVIAITDRAAERASPAERERMATAFIRSAQLEWLFWYSAYRMEAWPVGV